MNIPIFYINLNRRPDRRRQFEQQIAAITDQLPIRIEAIETPEDGAVGCARSHIAALEMAQATDADTVMICEDDMIFTHNPICQFTKWINISQWDMLLLGGNNAPPFQYIADTLTSEPIGIRCFNCQTTTAYIVRRNYIPILLENFREGVLLRQQHKEPQYAIDIYWKRLQQPPSIWILPLPIMATQSSGFSNIENRETDYNRMMLDPIKLWLHCPSSKKHT